ncbi:nucleotidyltransferase domain-containing protein [Gemmatimonadota bacterium]
MGIKISDNIAEGILGKTRSAVLSLLFLRPEERMYVREIIKEVGSGSGSVQRELEQLEQYGLIERSVSGKQVYYQAVSDHPLYRDLTMFLVKTTGIADVIRDALRGIEEQIEVALLYGSIARGDLRKDSDIDLMIIGMMEFRDVSGALSQMAIKLHRELNPTVYPPTEFTRKVQSGNHFLRTVLDGDRIMLIGGEDELGRLVDPSMGEQT